MSSEVAGGARQIFQSSLGMAHCQQRTGYARERARHQGRTGLGLERRLDKFMPVAIVTLQGHEQIAFLQGAGVDGNPVHAIEHHGELAANEVLELRLGVGCVLRLTGQDHARGILRHGLEHLAGKKHQRHFDDREQKAEKYRRDQRKLDRG